MDKLVYYGTGLALVGVAVMILAPTDQIVGWVIFILGTGIIACGIFYNGSRIAMFKKFIYRKRKQLKQLIPPTKPDGSHTHDPDRIVKAQDWLDNTSRAIKTALADEKWIKRFELREPMTGASMLRQQLISTGTINGQCINCDGIHMVDLILMSMCYTTDHAPAAMLETDFRPGFKMDQISDCE